MNQLYIKIILLFLFLSNPFLERISDPIYNIYGKDLREDSITVSVIDPSELKGKEIIDKYISSIGGRELIEKVMDRTIYLTGNVNNVEVIMVIYQKIPDMYYQKTNLGAVEQKIIYDGKDGTIITGDDSQEIRGDELAKLKYEATLQLMLYLDAYGVKTEYQGIETVEDDREAYKVALIFPGGFEWTEYYDTATNFKIKEIKPISSPDGDTVKQITFYDDYREVEGVKYPFEIEQILGPSDFIFSVDSIKVNTGLINRNFEN